MNQVPEKTISWSKYKNLKQHVMKEQRSASLQVLYRKNDAVVGEHFCPVSQRMHIVYINDNR
jgi:hypothetical protein